MYRVCILLILIMGSIMVKGQMLPLSDHQLIESSENIVRGKVISSEAKWVDTGKYIYTFTKLQVDNVMAGNEKSGHIITIVSPGGYDPIKDMGMRVSHQAIFEEGEDVVVYLVKAEGERDAIDYTFLKNDPSIPDKIMRVNGYFQGKHKIFKDEVTQKTMILKANENKVIEFDQHQRELKQELKHLHVK